MFKGMMKTLLVAMCLVCIGGEVLAVEVQNKLAEEEKAKIFLQLGHSLSVKSVAISPDGRTIVSGSDDSTLKLWDVASGRELRTLSGDSSWINSVAISPDGRTVISGGLDKTIKLWDVATGHKIRTLRGHRSTVNAVAFSPDGRTIVSGSEDRTLKLWDVASGRELHTLRGHSKDVTSAAISPDGRIVASGSWDQTIKLWDVASGREIRTLKGHEDEIKYVTFTSDGSTLVAGGHISGTPDTTLKLWDVASGRELKTMSTQVGYAQGALAISPDGRTIAVCGEYVISLLDVASGREIFSLRGHDRDVNSVAFFPDGRTLISGGADNTIRLWDVASGQEQRPLRRGTLRVASVKVAADGRTMIASQTAGQNYEHTSLRLWDVASGRVLSTIGADADVDSFAISSGGHSIAFSLANAPKTLKLRDTASGNEHTLEGYRFLAFSPDERYSAIRGNPGDISLWDIANGRKLYTLAENENIKGDALIVAFSPDGRTLVSDRRNGLITLWDVTSGRKLYTLGEGNEGQQNFDAFSPDGRILVTSNGDNYVTLWDVASGRKLRNLKIDSETDMSFIAFSPDGRTLVTSNTRNYITLWDVASGRNLFKVLSNQYDETAFSPDGRIFAGQQIEVGKPDVTKLWDVATGRELRKLNANGKLTFSPDGRNLLVSTTLFDVATGRELNTLDGYGELVNSASFSSNNIQLFTGSTDGTIRKWDVATGKEIIKYVSFDNGEWIAITPEGYYTASEKGGDWLNVRLGNKVQGINQFYDVFYRPDIVEAKLRGEDISGMVNLTIDDAMKTPPPEVAFTTVPSASSATKEKVCYKITSTGGGIGEVRLFQNGKLVKSDGFYREAVAKREDKMLLASANGEGVYRSMRSLKMVKGESTIQTAKSKGDVVEECQEIDAIPGENELGVVAFNAPNTVQSSMGQASFNSSRPAQAPHLYILSIGINQFADPGNNLHYAAKDALDFQKLMQEKSGTLFAPENIHVTSLTDQQASKQGILGKLDELSGQIKPWDSFVLFVASHGVLLGTQYYLVSANFDGTGSMDQLIGSNEIVELSKKVRALNQLFIFDTCHAGGVDNIVGGLYDARMSVLAKKMGLHIYASAGGLQEALDGYQGNGLFTHALLDSMNSSGTTDSNGDKQVSVMELGARAKQETTTISTKLGSPQSPNIINFGKDNALFGVR